jgi:FkbM family methyltransferase
LPLTFDHATQLFLDLVEVPMPNPIARYLLKRYLRHQRLHGRPIGDNMAIFLDDFIGEKILLDGCFDLQELRCLQKSVLSQVRSGSVCLDIGANIGNHARFFSNFFPAVYAFEPHPQSFHLLAANSFRKNISVFNFGLSDYTGYLPVIENLENIGASKISGEAENTGIKYFVQRLDDLVKEHINGDIGFIKIDVEGHEARVIRGARQTLHDARPILVFEVLHTSADLEPEAVTELRAIGYSNFYYLHPAAVWKKIGSKTMQNVARAVSRFITPSSFEQLELRALTRNQAFQYAVIVAAFEQLQ